MNQLLILVDIQNDYFEGGANPLVGSKEAAEKAAILISHFRQKGAPIFYIRHDAGEEASFFRPGTHGIQVNDIVKPHPIDTMIIKTEVNSFKDTSLKEQIKIYNVNQLIICGMQTHMCVDSTVRAASDIGFDCIVVSDACATKDLTFEGRTIPAADVQAAHLAALNGTFAKVMSTEELLSEENFNSATA